MLRGLVLIARWIDEAHDVWRAQLACVRPLAVENAVLHEGVERLREELDLLRARLRRLAPHRRPHDRPWERLRILWHQPRHRPSLETTARTFVVSVPTLLDWKRDLVGAAGQLVRARHPVCALPDLVAELVRRPKRE